MKGQIFMIDAFNSMLVFLGILIFINFMWNSNLMEFERQNKEVTYLRSQQTLDLILSRLRSGNTLDEAEVLQFVNQTDYNYTAVKESLGIWDLNFRFVVRDWNNEMLYGTSHLPGKEDIMVIRRAAYMREPVKIVLWVWG